MRTLAFILALVVGAGALVISRTNLGRRERDAQRKLEKSRADRYVDFGVVLDVVVRDDINGESLKPGAPKMRIVRTHRFGGMFDTVTKSWTGPSLSPVRWLVSVEQEPIVLHDESMPPGVWMQGSMGAGKTTAGAIWLALRIIKHAEHRLAGGAGVTAPTDRRMEYMREAIFGPKGRDGERLGGMWPRAWYSWREGDQVASVVTGLQIEFRSGHIQSAAAGSPFQGQNWAFVLNDELQDYFELDGDIIMRGRAAWLGRYERFVTATPKDDPGYRSFREQIGQNATDWFTQTVLGPNSPFVHDEHWERSKRSMSDREYRRKVWAEDLASELRVYHAFDRNENMRPVPHIGAFDVTGRELQPWGRFRLLVVYDPGQTVHASAFLTARAPHKAPPNHAPDWYVTREVISQQATVERHIIDLTDSLRKVYGMAPQDVLVRADPAGDTESDDQRPDLTVYKQFQRAGFTILAADYRNGRRHLVPRNARIDMMNTLLCDATGRRRLFLACDDQRQCLVPTTLQAFEVQERDAEGKAERGKKGKNDFTHYTVNLGYGLWAIEKPRLDSLRDRRTA